MLMFMLIATHLQIPYLTLFRTRSVIAVYVAVIGNFITFNFANTYVSSR